MQGSSVIGCCPCPDNTIIGLGMVETTHFDGTFLANNAIYARRVLSISTLFTVTMNSYNMLPDLIFQLLMYSDYEK